MRSTSQRITDEVIIDIKEVIWRLLEQWKAIIIVSLCFMAVFVASAELDYSIDMKKAEKNTDEKQLTAKEIIDSLPKEEQPAVKSAERLELQKNELSQYIVSAPIMNIDANHCKRVIVNFVIDSDDKGNDLLSQLYVMELQSESVISELCQSCKVEMSEELFGELIRVTSPTEKSQIVCCEVSLTEEMDADSIQKKLKQRVEQIHDRLERGFSQHQIENYKSEVIIVSDKQILDKQNEILTDYTEINRNLKEVKNDFSTAQNEAYLSLHSENKDLGADHLLSDNGFSLHNIVVGLIIGAFLYAVLFFLYSVLTHRVFSTEILKKTSIRLLGELYCPIENSSKSILFRDRSVWERHHKKSLDMEKEMLAIIEAIESICKYNRIDNLLLVLTAFPTDNQRGIITDLQKRIRHRNIELSFPGNIEDHTTISDKSIIDADGVLLIVIESKTKLQDLGLLIDRCDDYKKPLIGSVYVG